MFLIFTRYVVYFCTLRKVIKIINPPFLEKGLEITSLHSAAVRQRQKHDNQNAPGSCDRLPLPMSSFPTHPTQQ